MPSKVSLPGAEHDREPTAEELKRELAEAREQQVATHELLRIIGQAHADPQSVLEAIARNAARLCGAKHTSIWRSDRGLLRAVATHNVSAERKRLIESNPIVPGRDSVVGRAALDRCTIHIADALADPELTYWTYKIPTDPTRTVLVTPMLKGSTLLGVIFIHRNEVRPFSPSQVALLEAFADQAVIAIENTRLFEELQARTRELQEALEYQTATSNVLNVISRSPTDVQPVFDAIAESAARLCKAQFCHVFRFDGELIHFSAAHGHTVELLQFIRRLYPVAPSRVSAAARAILSGVAETVPDILTDSEYHPDADIRSTVVFRSIVAVPMLKDGRPVGAIAVARSQTGYFPERQVTLLRNFADQAVIAIENARLFEAEQERTHEVTERTHQLTEALEYQTATSNVLNVISRSPNALQPVLNTIVETAASICRAQLADIAIVQGENIHIRASFGELGRPMGQVVSLDRSTVMGRAVLDKAAVHVADMQSAGDDLRKGRELAGKHGHRTIVGVPLMRENRARGALLLRRSEVEPFSEKQIALLQTFADQAGIAIENTRLFEEVQARTSELQTRSNELARSLEYQTAISSVLEVISRSKFDLQPVLQTLVENAAQLCDASTGVIFRFDGKVFQWVADHGSTRAHRDFQQRNPIGPGPGSSMGRVALHRRTIHIPDALADPEFEHTAAAKIGNFRTLLGVPMLRDGALLGVFSLQRHEVRPFTDKQIELVESFADQAVIAIENTRLFEEVQARNRDLTALGEVGRAVGSTLDLKVVLRTIVERAVHLSGTDAGSMFYYRAEVDRFELGETTGLDEETVARFRKLDISAREGGLGEAIAKRQPVQIPDLSQRPRELLRDAVLEAGFRASLIVPLLGAEGPVDALVLRRRQPGEFFAAVVSLMQAFADQSAIALENARLFEEIAQKSRELEIASQHKSQFVANMSHELRTPLAAILGFAELIQEGFYGPLPDKSMDALTRIRSNGKHLLGLINSVLDIAKIESGQFSLNLGEYALENVVETVRAATEALAETKKLGLKTEVADRLPIGVGDEQRLTQVLLNLVGNAIKFTDKGEVRTSATAVNGQFMVSVTDTGPGIPLEEQKRIFEQFHQVDSSNTKAKGGTGLGLAIAKQIVEMHGGRIWVESTPGEGATFEMELPMLAENRKAMA